MAAPFVFLTGATSGAKNISTLTGNIVSNIVPGEVPLLSITYPTNPLAKDKDTLRMLTAGIFLPDGNAKQLRLYANGSLLFDTTMLVMQNPWLISMVLVREDSTTLGMGAFYVGVDSNTVPIPTVQLNGVGVNMSLPLTLEWTGDSAVANNIIQGGMIIDFFPS